jgi:lipid II isoglutaminyl synthase (glutamine-hydrolysing)
VPRIAPNALPTIANRLRHGSALVSGTNGKTTTSRIIAHLLRGSNLVPLHNRAGANLVTGLVSAVVEQTTLAGNPRGDVGLFEVDEATLPKAIQLLQPRFVVLTNIFRDQLDRYGEVQFIFNLWKKAFDALPPESTLILNADDPLVAALGQDRSNVVYFGLGDTTLGESRPAHAVDARLCARCGARYEVELTFYSHLGHYRCLSCGLTRPQPTIVATRCQSLGDQGSRLTIGIPGATLTVDLKLPGLYNVYNALAAVAVCVGFGLAPAALTRDLETFIAAFGRLERIEVEDRHLFLALVKNPVGFTEVLKIVASAESTSNLAILINDHFADGTDVSWLWDVEFELLFDKVNAVICSGTRAEDLAVRLKYAQIPVERIHLQSEPRHALEQILERSDPGDTVYILPTYTAMLEVRDILRKTGYVRPFYED